MITDIKIGITGLPGSGKTFALLRVIEMLKEEELIIGGMIDEPIREGRHRIGFTVRDLMTGESAVFASADIDSRIVIGKLGVDLDKLDHIGVSAIKRAFRKPVRSSCMTPMVPAMNTTRRRWLRKSLLRIGRFMGAGFKGKGDSPRNP